jgi:hypothetical protein
VVLSKRERTIAVVLAAAVVILIGDRMVFTPYFDALDQVQATSAGVREQLDKDTRLMANRKRVNDAWKLELASGLRTDPAEAENQTLHLLKDAAQAARVDLQSVKPDRPARIGDFLPVRVQATGAAGSAGVAELVWRVETSGLPLRINELRLLAAKEGTDNLQFQMSVTTLAYVPLPKAKTTAAAGRSEVAP